MVVWAATGAWASTISIVAPAGLVVSLRCPHGEPVPVYRDGTSVETGEQTWVADETPGTVCEVWLGDEPLDWIALQGRSWCDGEGCRTTRTEDRGVVIIRGEFFAPELRCPMGRFPGRKIEFHWSFETPVDPCWLWDKDKQRGDHPVTWGSWSFDRFGWQPLRD